MTGVAAVRVMDGAILAFDANGDIKSRVVSVFQIRKDSAKPANDVVAQFHYIEAAPQS